MSLHNHVKYYGYTMIELVLAIAMIGTVSAIALPKYTAYIAKTKETVCMLNRQEIIYEYKLYCILEDEIPLEDYMRLNCIDWTINPCPSEGSYTAEGISEQANIFCSAHQKTKDIHLETKTYNLLTKN